MREQPVVGRDVLRARLGSTAVRRYRSDGARGRCLRFFAKVLEKRGHHHLLEEKRNEKSVSNPTNIAYYIRYF